MFNKFYLLAIFSFMLISCTPNKSSNKKEDFQTPSLDWLVGKWSRTNDNIKKQTFENWKKITEKEYVGFGFTIENLDTVFKENLKLVNHSSNWTLQVTGVNPTRTDFTFTNQTQSSFICENKENDFPKIIKYKMENDTLKAVVSNDEMEIPFNFVKVK